MLFIVINSNSYENFYYEKTYFKWTHIVRWLCTLLVQWLVQLLRQQKRLNGLGYKQGVSVGHSLGYSIPFYVKEE